MKKTILILVVSLFLGSMILTAANEHAIWGCYVKYKSSTEVYITAGSGRCNGTIFENGAETTLDLTSVLPAGEDFVYIYVDDSASSYPTPTFIGSTTEPAWNSTSPTIGWYNGDDRCIGVVWVDSLGNIQEFTNNSMQEYYTVDSSIGSPLVNGNPDGTYRSLESTNYIPINATAVRVYGVNKDSGANVRVAVASLENTNDRIEAYEYGSSGTIVASARGWITLKRGASRDLQWFGDNDDNNDFDVHIQGFRIER